METLKLASSNVEECAARAAEILRAGGVVLYPTDTLYGLGADAFSDAAVEKVYAIKGREADKPIHCVVADMEMAKRYAEVNGMAEHLATMLLPGPLTLILKKHSDILGGIAHRIETIGIRIPKSDFCLALARNLGPYTTTSANISGLPSLMTVEEILTQLGAKAAGIDLVIDGGPTCSSVSSTVVDARTAEPVILREGAIPAARIRELLQNVG